MVKNHLSKFDYSPANSAMISRLETALANGEAISGADASFYMHELAESTMMSNGIGYDAAHAAALAKYDVSPFSVYHIDVINMYSEWFSKGWKAFWENQ